MEKELAKSSHELQELLPSGKNKFFQGGVYPYGRYIIGKSEICDIQINDPELNSIHAILELTPNKNSIYDMNSLNGTFVNGKKVVASTINKNDSFAVGKFQLRLASFIDSSHLPPVLDILEPHSGEARIYQNNKSPTSVSLPHLPPSNNEHVEQEAKSDKNLPATPNVYVSYPLAKDPKAEYSEYIFEDLDQVYPIFDYNVSQKAIEVILLFKGDILSVDYLPIKKGTYYLRGKGEDQNSIEFAYLGVLDKIPFIEVDGQVKVYQLNSFKAWMFKEDKAQDHLDSLITIKENEILKLEKQHLEIYIRQTESPPRVKLAPFLNRDQDFRKYLLLILLLLLIPMAFVALYDVPKEGVDEKQPERLATLLNKNQFTVKRKVSLPKDAENIIKPEKKLEPPKPVVKTPEPSQGKKDAKLEAKDVAKGNPSPDKIVPNQTQLGKAPQKSTNLTAKTTSEPSKSIGKVQVYKSADFKSTVSNILAKGGTTGKTADVKSYNNSSVVGEGGARVGTGTESGVKSATLSGNAGSLIGTSTGKNIGEVKGAEGLSSKTNIMTAGIPSETVIVGSMDPDIIRRILREHIPQFRFCYQKELDRTNKTFSGIIRLNFTIGASGSVSQAGVEADSSLPGEVRGCVVSVLKGIQFPQPAGGGTVGVKQPMNFYPTRI